MPTFYHGSSRAFATAMAGIPTAGTITINRGEGEFGLGFYTQQSSSNAARRGHGIYSINGAVLELIIDNTAYNNMKFKRLTLNKAQKLNARLKASKAKKTYTTKDDVIVGPLVKQPKIEQQKFQTTNACNILNGTLTQRSVI